MFNCFVQLLWFLKFINGGVRLFSKSDDKVCDCGYRIAQDGVPIIYPYLDPKCLVEVNREELIRMLLEEKTDSASMRPEVKEQLDKLATGCCVIFYKEVINTEPVEYLTLPICCWKGQNSIRPFVSRSERIHFLRMIDHETICLETEERKRFQERQEKKMKRRELRNKEEEENVAKEVESQSVGLEHDEDDDDHGDIDDANTEAEKQDDNDGPSDPKAVKSLSTSES